MYVIKNIYIYVYIDKYILSYLIICHSRFRLSPEVRELALQLRASLRLPEFEKRMASFSTQPK